MEHRLWRVCVGVLLGGLAAAGARGEEAIGAVAGADAAFRALADDYFDNYYLPTNPSAATQLGIHRYDSQFENFSHAELLREIAALKGYAARVAAVDPVPLSEPVRADRALLLASIQSALLTDEQIRPLEKNPDVYSSSITASAYLLAQRDFAPPNERLRALIAREKQMPAALQFARQNLSNPPRIFTSIALEQLPGDVGFFEHDLPLAFAKADDAGLQQQFATANGAVIAALRDYQHWLEQLLRHSHGDFRLGAKVFADKLRYDEMVDTPLPQLLAIGLADLHSNQQHFARVAKQLEPDKTARQVLAELALDHPAPADLLPAFKATFDGLVSFIDAHHIVTVPASTLPILRETPAFMRATTFASMDPPGPFETTATEAYFNVTPTEPDWSAERVAGFMAQFNYPVISNVTVHEAFPGHYVQFLWFKQFHDRVRQIIYANSNVEGWAHYCEQMMLDEGFGQTGSSAAEQRAAARLRLGQLQDALLRDARFIVSIQMHTGKMSIDQAVQYFVREGYQSKEVGLVETQRGTGDPTYLYYTLGKLQIMKLRADLKAREGEAFSLQSFHDRFLQQGGVPIKLVRRAMLQDDSPTL
jgi:uncharacterized protein (DUF885 family)